MPVRSGGSRGSTTLLLIGTIAIVLAITLQIYRRGQITQARGSLSNLIDHSEIIRKTLESRLKNPESCFKTLEGLTIAPGESVSPILNFVYDPEIKPEAKVLKKGDEVSSGIELDQLSLELAAGPDMRVKYGDETRADYKLIGMKRYSARLHIGFRSAKGESLAMPMMEQVAPDGSKELQHGIPLYVWVDDNNRMTSCFGTNSVGALCNEFGGYFMTDAKNPQDRCRQSIYAEKTRADGTWRSLAACRSGGVVESAKECNKKLGGGNRKPLTLKIQDTPKNLIPSGPKASLLCVLCF